MTDTTDEGYARPFEAVLMDLGRGRTLDELTTAMHDLTAAVRETGKGGSITLQLKVAPTTKGQTDNLTVTDQVKVVLPQLARPATVFFVDDANNLSRDNPHQQSLPLTEVPPPPAARELPARKDINQ